MRAKEGKFIHHPPQVADLPYDRASQLLERLRIVSLSPCQSVAVAAPAAQAGSDVSGILDFMGD
jgi:hypothetical protein